MPDLNLDDRESDFDFHRDNTQVVFRPNHQLMARPRLRERDMQPQGLFFYRRITDEKILCFTEQEAAMMMKSTHGVILQQLGVSDGSTYRKFILNCGIKPGTVISGEKAQKILGDAFNAELEAAKGHYRFPQDQNVHFDATFPVEQRSTFVPPK